MPQRTMRARGRIPILQDEARAARQQKHRGRACRTPQKDAWRTRIKQTARKTCAAPEVVYSESIHLREARISLAPQRG
jgi:hypothetical protein